jgi:hypothetical protein
LKLAQTVAPTLSGNVEVRTVRPLVQPSFNEDFPVEVNTVAPLTNLPSWDATREVDIVQVTPIESTIENADPVRFLRVFE